MMPKKTGIFFLTAVLVWLALVTGGCAASTEKGATWAADKTFEMTPQALTEQQKEKIRQTLDPDGDGVVFTENGFVYNNMALSDEERNTPAKSKEDAIEIAKSCLRELGLLPAEGEYFMRADEWEPGRCDAVFVYRQFHDIPIILAQSPEIRIGISEKGVESLRYGTWYSIETVKLDVSDTPAYLSEEEAKKHYENKYSPKCSSEQGYSFQKVYVYTRGQAKPMYMFGDSESSFLNAAFVDALTGETTDYPWPGEQEREALK